MEQIRISEDSLTSPSDIGVNNCSPTTYITLTPLQPLSSVSLEKSDSIYGGIARGLQMEAARANSNRSGTNEFDYCALVNDYEFLEPLQPTVYVDREGNAVECTESSMSFTTSATFLSPRLSHCDWKDKSSLIFSDDSLDGSSQTDGYQHIESSQAATSDNILQSPTSTSVAYTPNPMLLAALKTVSTPEDIDKFMSRGVVETRDLSSLIGHEIRRCNIPQALFSQRVLGRSQGTLSDLLRNPRHWTKLKSGREQFVKIWQWLQEPEARKWIPFQNEFDADNSSDAQSQLVTFNGFTSYTAELSQDSTESSPVRPKKMIRSNASLSSSTSSPALIARMDKKPRIIFNETQRHILQSTFNRDPRPSREVQNLLAEQLNLPYMTIANFFVNARRKLRKDESEATIRLELNNVGSGEEATVSSVEG